MYNKIIYSVQCKDGKRIITIDYPTGMIHDKYDVERMKNAIAEIICEKI